MVLLVIVGIFGVSRRVLFDRVESEVCLSDLWALSWTLFLRSAWTRFWFEFSRRVDSLIGSIEEGRGGFLDWSVMDDRRPHGSFFQYPPSGLHPSPHRSSSFSSDRERWVQVLAWRASVFVLLLCLVSRKKKKKKRVGLKGKFSGVCCCLSGCFWNH